MQNLAGDSYLTEEKKSFFIEAFHLDPRATVEEGKGVKSSTSLKYLIFVGGEPSYFVKEVPFYANEENALCERMTFVQWLRKEKFPVPSLLLANQQLYQMYQGRKWQLFSYEKGHPCLRNSSSIQKAFRLLAEFHRKSLEYAKKAMNRSDVLHLLFKQTENLTRILRDEQRDYIGSFEELVTAIRQKISNLLPDIEYMSNLVHGDFSLNNILFQNDTPVCLVDFDNIHWNMVYRDMSELILTSSCFFYEPNSTHFAQDTLPLLLLDEKMKGYASLMAEKISGDHELLLPIYMSCVYLELVALGFVREDFTLNNENINVVKIRIENFLQTFI